MDLIFLLIVFYLIFIKWYMLYIYIYVGGIKGVDIIKVDN